jgi:hypothetical protein
MFDLGGMTTNHVLYIPLVALLALVVGYNWGARSTREEMDRRRRRLKE